MAGATASAWRSGARTARRSAACAYKKILSHYYPGTKLAEAPTGSVRVLLAEGRRTVSVASEAPFQLMDGKGEIHDLAPGSYSTGTGFAVALDPALPPETLPGPLTFLRGKEPLLLGTKPYRGNFQLQRVHGRLQVVNVLGIDPYIRGVVSEEVPEDWPLEVVKAQAVAARSYALAQAAGRSILYSDTRSQVYGGIEAESDVGDKAVAATSRQVLMFDGKVATTFFFSSSGGRTAAVEDVFIGGTPVPYLVSVPDPDDKLSPHHRWGPVVLPAPKVARLLGAAVRDRPTNGSRLAAGPRRSSSRRGRASAGCRRARSGVRSTYARRG